MSKKGRKLDKKRVRGREREREREREKKILGLLLIVKSLIEEKVR